MAQIPQTLGAGGAHLNPSGGAEPTLLEILDDVAADLAALQPDAVATAVPSAVALNPPAAVTETPLGAVSTMPPAAVTETPLGAIATPDGTDAASTQSLANDTKAKVNDVITRVDALSAALNDAVDLATANKAKINEVVTRLDAVCGALNDDTDLAAANKTALNLLITLASELRTRVNAPAGATLLTLASE